MAVMLDASSPSRRSRIVLVLVAAVLIGVAIGAWFVRKIARDPVSFSNEIQPILNQNCVQCHGGVRQKNGVSFVFREDALGRGKSGRLTIVPGHPEKSELIARITSSDPEARMPYHAPPLPSKQIELLRRWIKEGAKWEDHWAFVAPKPQPLPTVKQSGWIRQPLDRFILARLEKEVLAPSPEASKAELLRRVSFDLTGLPPTLEEQASFLADSSPDAYEKQVDRLLASPRYGERWAASWLDLARYADSKGYEADRERPGVWPYRDWVIQAFNRNLPYDKFVIKQLAGDLLPEATFDDQIATSFHRQTPNNDEGGTDDEEFRLIAAMDRSATTWSVLNGLTMNCVQCHSHPYDPIRHAEYYKSLAFFNTSRDADLPEDTPTLHVPKDKNKFGDVWRLQQDIADLSHSMVNSDRRLESQSKWVPLPITTASATEALALEWEAAESERELAVLDKEKLSPKEKKDKRKYLLATIADDRKQARSKAANPSIPLQAQDGEMRAAANTPGKSVYEVVAAADAPIITALRIEVLPTTGDAARHNPEDGFIVDQTEAWVIQPSGRQDKIRFRSFVADSDDDLKAAIARAIKFGASVDLAGGLAANPSLFRPRWMIGLPNVPLRITRGSRIRVRLTQIENINDKPAHVRRARLSASSDSSWAELIRDKEYHGKLAKLSTLTQELAKIPSVETPVMLEQPSYAGRETLEFERGNFLTKIGPALTPDVPGLFPRLPDDAPRNRLTLAKWFFSPQQPLTARTAVNRYWEQLFGTGIVETLENFGSMGERPSHLELLDWLALHFENDLHWDMKALLRELVTSATYRQSAKSTPTLTEKDPRNRLLARGPQQRLSAEMVRDQALIASGLLSDTMGGPPVMPPQPEGVWNSVYNDSKWVDAKGPNRYRRAIYTYIKRTSGYPSFLIFDASDHDVSLARRISTNTPLQALVTMNDPVYVEASEALAGRMRKASDTTDGRLRCGARLVLSRDLTDYELATLRELFEKASAESGAGVLQRPAYGSGVSGKEQHAMTAVAMVLLNLDAALTR
jgi:Protein of unknown function (DUF1553)/Protein of unknown function (DUF1549)/Planctomycete cytochrome C